ncbi:hypothetical protein KKG46_00810 [Patescibacteria group bacterium]|nr:hypothetical protein [Patescibacteria group bacterium]
MRCLITTKKSLKVKDYNNSTRLTILKFSIYLAQTKSGGGAMSKIEKESASGYIFLGTMAFVLILMIGVFVFSDKEYNAEHKEAVQQDLQRQADERAITMVYSKDARTGLCYAFSGPYFTHVPCDTAPIKPFASTDK